MTKSQRNNFLIHANFHTAKIISLSFCCKKIIYIDEYIDCWEKFSEKSLPQKEDFYSHLNMEGITDADYAHAKRVCKDFEKKKLGEYF